MLGWGIGTYYHEFRRFQKYQPYPYFLHLYQNLSQALSDSLTSLIKLYPHKKRMLLLCGLSPFEKMLIQQAQNLGCQVKTISYLSEMNLKDVQVFDPGVIVFAHDHALTGESFLGLASVNIELLRVGVLSWSHYIQATEQTQFNYHIRVIPKHPQRFVAYCSERIETPPSAVIYDLWNEVIYPPLQFKQPIDLNSLVQDLEQKQFKVWTRMQTETPYHLLLQYLGEDNDLKVQMQYYANQLTRINWQELNLLPSECLWSGISLEDWQQGAWLVMTW